MRFGYRDVCLDHQTGPRHPESADRLEAIRRRLSRLHGVEYDPGDLVDVAMLERVHDPEYVTAVRKFCADGGGTWDADTLGTESTWEAARASAGLSAWAAEAALDGDDGRDTPFAIGRPPGHHAVYDDAMGFCFFNNAVVAARVALDHDGVDRVAILDWDVHHGNGTQDITYDWPDVHYSSVHERGLYPGTGKVGETGGEGAERTNVNVPLPGGCGDAEYLAALDDAVLPSIERFDPDVVVVSAGFDAHEHDPISRMRVTTEGYGVLTDRVRTLAEGTDAALAFVLEGGYGLDALAESVAMVHEVFDGRDPVAPDGDPTGRAATVVDEVSEAHDL